MSIAALVAKLRSRGIFVRLEGTLLSFVAVGVATEEVFRASLHARRSELYRHFLDGMREKRVGDLTADREQWPEEAIERFQERAAIIEFEADQPRALAEMMAEIGVRQLRAAEGQI